MVFFWIFIYFLKDSIFITNFNLFQNCLIKIFYFQGERFGEGEKFYHFACFDRDGLTESTTVLRPTEDQEIQTVSGQLEHNKLRDSLHQAA